MPDTLQTGPLKRGAAAVAAPADHLTETPSYMRSTMSSRNRVHGAAVEKDERTEKRKERAAHLLQPIRLPSKVLTFNASVLL